MEFLQYIEINPAIMMGKPVIRGTRITIEQLLEELSASYSIEEIFNAHPHLRKEQVQAALVFAAQSIRGDEIYPVAL
ncbi:MAG: DUF433 domain-containing protein [Chitinophagaceae bacterium]